MLEMLGNGTNLTDEEKRFAQRFIALVKMASSAVLQVAGMFLL